jgi:type IV pilus assembly protein PilC
MALFDYSAINDEGVEESGAVEAEDPNIGISTLKDRGLSVISITERRSTKGFSLELSFLNRVKTKDLVIFSRQLSVMVSATLPVVQALRILTKQIDNTRLKIVISEIADFVDGGASLSEAFGKYPDIFSNFYISMVKSGEASGKLDEVLNYLADQQEKDYDLMSKTRGAMIYPAFILCGLFGVGVVMMVFVLPKLTEILQESETELPITTRMLIGTSDAMSTYWWIFALGAIFIIGGFIRYRKTETGKRQTDYLLLKLPIFGPLIFQKIYLVRFTRSLSTLITGGVSITEALEITSQVVGNEVYKKVISDTVLEVKDGNSIATVFLTSPVVPHMLAQMLSVGERTGRIDAVLVKLSDFYSREVDNAVANLVTLIEPLILMLMGVAVGIMVAAILLPMYNLASTM